MPDLVVVRGFMWISWLLWDLVTAALKLLLEFCWSTVYTSFWEMVLLQKLSWPVKVSSFYRDGVYELYLKKSAVYKEQKSSSLITFSVPPPSLEILMSLYIVWLISSVWAAGSWRRLYQAFHSIYDSVSANGLRCTLLLLAQDIADADAFANPFHYPRLCRAVSGC